MDPESQTFEYTIQRASNSLYDLGSQIRKVEKLLNRQSAQNMSSLAREIAKLGSQSAQASSSVSTLNAWNDQDLTNSERKQQVEMTAQLGQLLNRVKEYQAAVTHRLLEQKRAEEAAAAQSQSAANETTPMISSESADPAYGSNGNLQTQQQTLDVFGQAELDLHTALIEDRDLEISEIQRGAREINSIFQDLGTLIAEQGHQIDTVEDNIANLAVQTSNANHQLDKAYKHQRGRGKWTCILLSVLLVITILVGLNVLA